MIRINNKIVGTFREFNRLGFITGEMQWQRGYVSRKEESLEDFMSQPVYLVEHGRRSGQLFILRPSVASTRYCRRMYLKKL